MNSYRANLERKDAALMLAMEMIGRLRESVPEECPLLINNPSAACACIGACIPKVVTDSYAVMDVLRDTITKNVKPKLPE